MTEEEFRKRLTEAEQGRLDELAASIFGCSFSGTYSFMLHWAKQIEELVKSAQERMKAEDEKKS